ncbi:hypothetical protein ABZW51_07590 [Streptomyces cellulosae]|uniref:hypothetical protein n=1 Tax=Streptomyces sp. UNC401CLCol TaxID=1449077 RepID=UPI0007E8BA70
MPRLARLAGRTAARTATRAAGRRPEDDLLPWAALACLLAPAALLWRGAPFLTAAGAACGLAAVTAASRLLIRRSRRLAAPAPSRRPGATTHSRRPGPAPHARRAGALPHARAHARRDAGSTPAG